MSYLSNLSDADKALLNIENRSLVDYYIAARRDFITKNPGIDFTRATLKIENIIFAELCDFTGQFECKIELKNCYFLNNINFYDCKFNKELTISHCFCDKEVVITSTSTFLLSFNLIMFSINRQLYVEGGKFEDCKWSIIDQGIVKINGGEYLSLIIGYWGGTILKELSFHFPRIKGLIKVIDDKTRIESLSLFQFSSDISIAIEDISVNLLSIYRFRNEKSFRLFNIKSFETEKVSEISISESFLGKAEFYSINFNSFKNVFFHDVHLVDCSFVNIKWKYKIHSFKGRSVAKDETEKLLPIKISQLEESFISTNKIRKLKRDPFVLEYYSKNREAYRQLKYSLSKQGDIVNEQKFHTMEMLAYNKSITTKNNFFTKVIIKLSYWLSDFGQSLSRPICALFIGHWVLFIILIFSGYFKNFHISLCNPTAEGFKIGFYEYFVLINPLRKTEFIFDGYKVIIDLLMRIWASYMLYNIIRASRRFIK